MKAVRHTANSL